MEMVEFAIIFAMIFAIQRLFLAFFLGFFGPQSPQQHPTRDPGDFSSGATMDGELTDATEAASGTQAGGFFFISGHPQKLQKNGK